MNKNKCKTIAETNRKIGSEKCENCPLDYWKFGYKNGGHWCPKWFGSVCALLVAGMVGRKSGAQGKAYKARFA